MSFNPWWNYEEKDISPKVGFSVLVAVMIIIIIVTAIICTGCATPSLYRIQKSESTDPAFPPVTWEICENTPPKEGAGKCWQIYPAESNYIAAPFIVTPTTATTIDATKGGKINFEIYKDNFIPASQEDDKEKIKKLCPGCWGDEGK